MKKITSIYIILTITTTINAQTHDHDHNHPEHHYEHASNEIGIGNFISYLVGEQEFEYGLHVHYLRAIEGSRFGIGLGFEQIFDTHNHKTVGIIGSYRALPHLIVAVSPGILFPNTEEPNSRLVVHSEAVYEFEIGPLHIGPTIELATTFEELHIGAGLHLGYAF